jgi:Flp pilus assembly protein TadD
VTRASRLSALVGALLLGGVPRGGSGAAPQQERLENAVRVYREVLAREPGNAKVRSNLGATLAAMGRYDEAIQAYREALAAAPGEPDIRLNLALALYKSGDVPRAAKELEVLLRDHPRDLRATLLLADCRLRLGEHEAVAGLLRPVEAEDPTNRSVLYMLGLALIRGGQTQEGLKRVERLLQGGNAAEAHYLLGVSALLGEDYPRALTELEAALALEPRLPSLRSYHGRALFLSGDAEGAERALREALAAEPNEYDACYLLAAILVGRGRTDEARPLAERALRLRPSSDEARKLLAGKVGVAPPPTDASGYSVLREGGYPVKSAIDARPSGQARLADSDLVIGVVIDGRARAYPVNQLFGPANEAVNDVLAGVPVVATWCPIAHSAAVFERRAGGRVVELGALGLEKGVLQLYDRETRSTWSQLSGVASAGPLRGRSLPKRESMLTTWGTWRLLHARTSAFVDAAQPDAHVYDADTIARITGEGEGPARNEDLVAGVESTTPPRAWLLRSLRRARALNDVAGEEPLLALLAADGVTVRVLRRRVDGRVLTFTAEGERLRDTETGSAWDGLSGRALSGPLVGRRLEPMVVTTALWYAWRSQQPGTTLWEGP